MALKAFEEFAPDPLAFPVGGKVYVAPPVPYEAGLRLQKIMAGKDDAEDLSVDDQWRLLMGPAYDEMVADGVPFEALNRACLTAMTDFRLGREAAERVWETGQNPEFLAALGAALLAASMRTGEASETPTPDSSSGTSFQKASTKKKAKAAPAPS